MLVSYTYSLFLTLKNNRSDMASLLCSGKLLYYLDRENGNKSFIGAVI